MKTNLLIIVVLFFTHFCVVIAQNETDYANIDSFANQSSLTQPKLNSKITAPITLSFCEDDGYTELNIKELKNTIFTENGIVGQSSLNALIISTSSGELFKVSDLNNTPKLELLCDTQSIYTDIAVNEEGAFFASDFYSIYEIDNCNNKQTIKNSSFTNSLSFDTQGNLYYGGTQGVVYRYNKGNYNTPTIWHNFKTGKAGGDFVILNNKMYISWNTGNKFVLYEVTYDSDFNYVSHIEVCDLPYNTYGLASEMGKLYGITPTSLFEINLNTKTTNTLVTNSRLITQGSWWGSAGIHEAMTLKATFYDSKINAINNKKELPDYWVNTVFGGQTIYLKIENETTGDFDIVDIQLKIGVTPKLSPPKDIISCIDDENDTIDVSVIETELLKEVTNEVTITYHTKEEDAINNKNEITPDYLNQTDNDVIYVRVSNTENDCFSYERFQVKHSIKPKVAPLETKAENRLLNSCYVDANDVGYFNLEDMLASVIFSEDNTYTYSFHLSLKDAEDDQNSISSTLTEDTITKDTQAIFVRVENNNGCESITNFFVSKNCFLSEAKSLFFPKYLTPNNDGYNDYWTVKGMPKSLQKQCIIRIFDRYGKIIYTFYPSWSQGWDGKIAGRPLPANDYWFTVEFRTLNKRYSGHFAIIRR